MNTPAASAYLLKQAVGVQNLLGFLSTPEKKIKNEHAKSIIV